MNEIGQYENLSNGGKKLMHYDIFATTFLNLYKEVKKTYTNNTVILSISSSLLNTEIILGTLENGILFFDTELTYQTMAFLLKEYGYKQENLSQDKGDFLENTKIYLEEGEQNIYDFDEFKEKYYHISELLTIEDNKIFVIIRKEPIFLGFIYDGMVQIFGNNSDRLERICEVQILENTKQYVKNILRRVMNSNK
ncbi:MAG: hypothetical protein GY828_08640 [Candidatus Gracilibacteria bacterium]|nr:hypothetical protein [Candidatus Gracilibacteria bacterium]